MPRLLDRSRQIPGGLKFYEPSTKWSAPDWSSFETIVDLLMQHRRANPYLSNKNGWATDRVSVANEVDIYNASICASHGWNNYITEATDFPKSKHPLLQSVSHAAAGAKLLTEWLGNGGLPVDQPLANSRASMCVGCPQNQKGDWSRYFTVPVSEAIRAQLSMRSERKLETPYDDSLGVCDACGCPLKLKVNAPLVHIKKYMTPEVQAALDPRCWVTKEAS